MLATKHLPSSAKQISDLRIIYPIQKAVYNPFDILKVQDWLSHSGAHSHAIPNQPSRRAVSQTAGTACWATSIACVEACLSSYDST